MTNLSPNNLTNSDNGLYPYQIRDLNRLFAEVNFAEQAAGQRLLYQLPTGAGKTRIFSEIVKRYMGTIDGDVVVLTHRLELCAQTHRQLSKQGVRCKVISGVVSSLRKTTSAYCYVSMVETMKNRIKAGKFNTASVGLLIVDEAHHNSFAKLISKFPHACVIGVTATPLSSDPSLPLKKTYDKIVIGEPIEQLIENGYLAKPRYYSYEVELNSLATGVRGDFTMQSSDALYSSQAMLELLLHACQQHAKGLKTLIFNTGVFSSVKVQQFLAEAGLPVKHIDHKTPSEERTEILKWFRKTKSAILTSVSMLTTGFDEPSVNCVILYRATTSLTLYHQMIGRGSRIKSGKKHFTIIDLGNNEERFGPWQQSINWQESFDYPELYTSLYSPSQSAGDKMNVNLRQKFPNSLYIDFDVQQAYNEALEMNRKPRYVISQSIHQHALMCLDNSNDIPSALLLSKDLKDVVKYRVKQYGKCLGKVTRSYLQWLAEDYILRLSELIERLGKKRWMGNLTEPLAAA
ncbi:DEAD/DEAH box helicase [Niabella yanshanensis]|uniref:DEAD/DEAH box helicase n=1 Tax=Niabella yanshanensis TaxID=577386 RepID=A0ABZ0WBZ8_9BACT|nr:DEAD/DEAH box helicase [Niabella yanshanensis]WQD39595.1 DEAD/DEAH box helicase [Niabella yanshanensis]